MIQWIVSGSLLILVLIGLRYLLRGRIKPSLQYALWALVLARLLIPIQFGSAPISIENTVEKSPLVQEIQQAERVEYFEYHLDGFATGFYTPAPNLGQTTDTGTENQPVTEQFTHAEADRITQLRAIRQILIYLWVGGMILVGVVFVVSNSVFALRLRKTRKLLEKGKLPVYVSDWVETPCLFGFFRPAIYLTPAVAETEHHRVYAIAHEKTHYRHGDFLWSALRCVCLIVHWYNPLVWWAAILSRADGEIACDEATISILGEGERAEYGRVLIDLTCRKTTDLLRTATTMTGSAKGLKERIKMIAKRPKMAVYTLVAVILVASIAVGCTFTGAGETKAPTTEPAETTEPTETTEPNDTPKLPAELSGTQLTEEELAQFASLFAYSNEYTNWYEMILACGQKYTYDSRLPLDGFTSPEKISISYLFYNGFYKDDPELRNLSDAEKAFLASCPGYVPQMDIVKLPAGEMERVLNTYLGVSLKDIDSAEFEAFWYFEEADCYYHNVSDYFSAEGFQIVDGKRGEDGTIYLLSHKNVKYMKQTLIFLCLTPNSGNEKAPYRVQICKTVENADEVLSVLRTSVPLPTEEEMATQGAHNSKYFLLRYLPGGEIMDGGYDGKDYTTDGMKMDYLYAIDDGVTYSISGGVVGRMTWAKDSVYDYVYFVRKDDPQKIWRTDLHGQNPTVVYESQYGDITFLSCVNGWLSIIENNNRASLLDMNKGKMTVLLEVYQMEQFSYDAAYYRVFWRGRLNQSDKEDNSYYYYLKTNEYLMMQSGTTGIPVSPET